MTKRFFILAEPRSGSSWLLETLNSHQEITLFSELYNHVLFREVNQFLGTAKDNFHQCIQYLENKLTQKNNRYTGCKILFNQLELISAAFSKYFIDHYKNSCFIFLYRENMFATQVSLRLAHTYNIWHVKKDEDIKKRKIHLNVAHLYNNLEKSRAVKEKILTQLENFGAKKMIISYEQLFADQKGRIKDICKFLAIPCKYIKFSSEKKGNPFKAEEVVENFEEVKEFLKQYPHYFQMLGE